MRRDRAALRGKPLDDDCKKAKTSKYECGLADKRIFCFGYEHSDTEELIDKCRECKAHVTNAS